MNSTPRKLFRLAQWMALLCLALPVATIAFPPAPNHLIFGIVRDQIGNPLDIDNAEIILQSSADLKVAAPVVPQLEPGANYRMEVSMDAGLTSDLYKPTALLPAAPFRLSVRIGQITFLPMEMVGDFSKLGLPGGRTRIDLTLGVDADGNGLPDAWEKAAAAFLGWKWSAGQMHPGDLYPGTGLTFREAYLAGTYAINPADGFALQIVNTPGESPKLAFTAVKGRAYTIQTATRLGEWNATPFRVLPLDSAVASIDAYQATVTRRLEIEAPGTADGQTHFYRLIVQ